MMPGAVIVGAGPGIGRSVARRFAREGLRVALVSRAGGTLDVEGARGYAADCADEDALRAVNVAGGLVAAAHVVPAMARRGGGTFLVTGGMPEPKRRYTSLSLGKSGVRTLVALLDQEWGPSGVHVATVTVAGPVAPGTPFAPDAIAEHYWLLHTQPRGGWDHEIVHTGGETGG